MTIPWPDFLLDSFLSPALALGAILALTYGGLVAILRGGNLRRVGLHLLGSGAGFAVGQALGTWLDVRWLRLGELQLLLGSVGALALALWAGRPRKGPPSKPATEAAVVSGSKR